MEKKEILKALDALKAEVEKKPEDKVLEKLEEILQAIRLQGFSHIHVCPPCTRLHYPYSTFGNGIVWTYGSNVTVGNVSENSSGAYSLSPDAQISWTAGGN